MSLFGTASFNKPVIRHSSVGILTRLVQYTRLNMAVEEPILGNTEININ
jgi:hypothetical protein